MPASSNRRPRTKTGCLNCREGHLKCDDSPASCKQCARANITCVRNFDIRFRHGGNPSVLVKGRIKCENCFSKDQIWLKTPAPVKFIDETSKLVDNYHGSKSESSPGSEDKNEDQTAENQVDRSDYQHEYDNSATIDGISPAHGEHLQEASPDILRDSFVNDLNEFQFPDAKRRRLFSSSTAFAAAFGASPGALSNSPSNSINAPFYSPSSQDFTVDPFKASRSSFPDQSVDGRSIRLPSLSEALGDQLSQTFSNQQNPVVFVDSPHAESRFSIRSSVWPLQEAEAKLLRHFVDTLARSFDLCDSVRHFAQIVPQRAAVCPILLTAIFAASARHLSKIGECDATISDHYHQECLSHLIPKLSDQTAMLDENLLAATVILRFLEEIEVPISGDGGTSHLLGTHVFISAQEGSAFEGGLRQAAFWVALRQEIYVAVATQRTIAAAFENCYCDIDITLGEADDFTWANRMIVHCADVIRFCFGERENNINRYNALTAYGEQWQVLKPIGFSSMHFEETEVGDFFPRIWLVGDHVVTALQHAQLAKILLAAHNPKTPKLGPASKAALAKIDDEIRNAVLTTCGMALSNPQATPNFVTACLVISMCGERFTDQSEQEALMKVLNITENQCGWPTVTAVQSLKEAWAWEDT